MPTIMPLAYIPEKNKIFLDGGDKLTYLRGNKQLYNEVAKIVYEMFSTYNVARRVEVISRLEAPNMTIDGNPTPNPCTPAEC
uniref:Uncharacterized protein n=1 Tax=Parascaris equorum TaxID=6256 RepID=A0A914RC09_PAREQ